MDRTIKIVLGLFLVLVIGVVVASLFTASGATETQPVIAGPSGNVSVYFFYGEGCPHCKNIEPFLADLSKKYPQVTFLSVEAWHNQTNAEWFAAINQKLGIKGGFPEVITGSTVLVGDREIPAKLEAAIVDQLKKKS
jgi:thiol-disulfide isomerase/thioredoxin